MSNFTPRAQQVLALARKEADRIKKERVAEEEARKQGKGKGKKGKDEDEDDDNEEQGMTFDKLSQKRKDNYEMRKRNALGSPVKFRVSR